MVLGVHVSTEGKIYEALGRAHSLGCNTMQIFIHSPQRWRENYLNPIDAQEFIRLRQKFRINPVFIHASYLINLACPHPRLYDASIREYIDDILEAQMLRADYIVTHMGSHKGTTEETGIKMLVNALNRILDKTKGSKVGILLENTSGAGSLLGYKFIHQSQVLEGIEQKKRVGICLDTAHAYLAGYDLASEEGLKMMLDEIGSLVGIKLVKLVHLNDTKAQLGSHRDVHYHIGKGNIGIGGMKRIINSPALKNCAFILETPKDTVTADKKNLEALRRLRRE